MKKVVLVFFTLLAALLPLSANEYRIGVAQVDLDHVGTPFTTKMEGYGINFASTLGSDDSFQIVSDLVLFAPSTVLFGASDVSPEFSASSFGEHLFLGLGFALKLGPISVIPAVGGSMTTYLLQSSTGTLHSIGTNTYTSQYLEMSVGYGAQVVAKLNLTDTFGLYGKYQVTYDVRSFAPPTLTGGAVLTKATLSYPAVGLAFAY
jgi:hypothetical protein